LSTSLEGLITEAFADAWGSGIDEILKCCYRSSDHRNKSGTIGIADGKPVKLDYLDIINKPFKK